MLKSGALCIMLLHNTLQRHTGKETQRTNVGKLNNKITDIHLNRC